MDENQTNHLKAYGIAYYCLERNTNVNWLLNYYGGSFCIDYNINLENECNIRNVSYKIITNQEYSFILNEISQENINMELIILEKKLSEK